LNYLQVVLQISLTKSYAFFTFYELYGFLEVPIFLEELFLETIRQEKTSYISKIVQDSKEILSHNLCQELSLKTLANKLNTNPYTLLRNFKKELGITPFSFRLNLRIELSKKLLHLGKDISEVALECGFFDQSHFQKYFKAILLVTPKEYQKNFMDKKNV